MGRRVLRGRVNYVLGRRKGQDFDQQTYSRTEKRPIRMESMRTTSSFRQSQRSAGLYSGHEEEDSDDRFNQSRPFVAYLFSAIETEEDYRNRFRYRTALSLKGLSGMMKNEEMLREAGAKAILSPEIQDCVNSGEWTLVQGANVPSDYKDKGLLQTPVRTVVMIESDQVLD